MILKKMTRLVVILCLVITSCKKNPEVNKAKPQPIKTGRGVANGTRVSKIIGPGGGDLVSADGKLKVIVAGGTVNGDTEFSIQPITNTLFEDENRIAYRLLPEGSHFTKPVQLQFQYTNDDTLNTSEDVLAIATQRQDGSWTLLPTRLDKSTKTLTVETTHFSDWTVTGGVYLTAERTQLGLGQKTMIKVVSVWDDEVLTQLVPTLHADDRNKLESIDNWKIVNGIGSLGVETGQLGRLQTEAEYGAPSDMTPSRRTMTITVDVKGYNLIKDPAAPGGVRRLNKIILFKRIEVIKEFIKAVIGGTTYFFNSSQVIATTGTVNGLLIGGRNSELDLNIQMVANAPGSYNCNMDNGVTVFLQNGSRAFSTQYMRCNGTGVVYSAAPIVIDKVGGVGEWIEGKFSGMLFDNQANACAGPVPTIAVEIEFNVVRRN